MTKKQEYNPNMRGAIWTETRVTTVTDESGKPKIVSPAFSGKIMVDGRNLKIRMWPVTSDNPKAPAYSIQIDELYQATESKEA